MPAVEETYGLMGHVVQQEILAAGLRQMVMRQRRSAAPQRLVSNHVVI
jgi:hypothetical protein